MARVKFSGRLVAFHGIQGQMWRSQNFPFWRRTRTDAPHSDRPHLDPIPRSLGHFGEEGKVILGQDWALRVQCKARK